jgi:hypothetical protein
MQMAFGTGTTAGVLSRTTNSACQTADKLNEAGKILEQTTHGGTIEIITETYSDTADNGAVSGQTGAGPLIIRDDYTESNQDYARKSETTRTVNV